MAELQVQRRRAICPPWVWAFLCRRGRPLVPRHQPTLLWTQVVAGLHPAVPERHSLRLPPGTSVSAHQERVHARFPLLRHQLEQGRCNALHQRPHRDGTGHHRDQSGRVRLELVRPTFFVKGSFDLTAMTSTSAIISIDLRAAPRAAARALGQPYARPERGPGLGKRRNGFPYSSPDHRWRRPARRHCGDEMASPSR